MTLTMGRVQARYGNPTRGVILDLDRQHSRSKAVVKAVADELGVLLIWNWRAKLGISAEEARWTILEGEGERRVQNGVHCGDLDAGSDD